MLGAIGEELIAGDELDLLGPERLCPALVDDAVYRAFVSVETLNQLFDIAALLVELVDLSGLRRFDNAA